MDSYGFSLPLPELAIASKCSRAAKRSSQYDTSTLCNARYDTSQIEPVNWSSRAVNTQRRQQRTLSQLKFIGHEAAFESEATAKVRYDGRGDRTACWWLSHRDTVSIAVQDIDVAWLLRGRLCSRPPGLVS